jgi:apolipoprotein D and lipocalin family protein
MRKQPLVNTPRPALATLLLCATFALFTGCLGMPAQVHPVNDFDLNRYLGQWHEIARLDHSFERGLEQVTASYSQRDDGGVRVINRGYSTIDDEWRDAEGKAYFMNEPTEGYLKVSFFGPFYGSYVIFELDQDYQYAFIAGANTDYLWLLARQPTVGPKLIAHFEQRAQALGFDTEKLIYPRQK